MSKLTPFFAGATTMASALAAVFMLTGARDPGKHGQFDEITVGRINIVEPDGTKRIIISNKAQFPGSFTQGKEIARPDRRSFAGMLFVSEEGTENGGLIQKGSIDADGKIDSGVSLTFDRFRQDQSLQLISTDSEKTQRTALIINDVPYYQITSMEDHSRFRAQAEALPANERRAFWRKLDEEGRFSKNRIWLGTRNQDSSLQLKDAQGRTRMTLQVAADGKAEILMYDEAGKVSKSITPTTTDAR